MKEEKKDNLEDFVQGNRDEFPQWEPSAGLWDKISDDLNAKDASHTEPAVSQTEPPAKKDKVISIKVTSLYRIAAVLVIGVGIGYFVGNRGTVDPANDTNIDPSGEHLAGTDSESGVTNNYYVSLSDVSPDLAETEKFYQQEIGQKLTQLEAFDVNQDLLDEVEILTSDYEELQKEMVGNHNNDRVVEAMIENYKLRLQVLETILEEMQKEAAATKSSDDVHM